MVIFVLSPLHHIKKAIRTFIFRYNRIRDTNINRVTKMPSPKDAALYAFKEAWHALWV